MIKKILIFFAGLFVLVIAAAIIIPIVFKDDIKAAIDAEIEKSVNADVYFDPANLNISLFSNFPNVTVGIEQFGVFNRAPFDGQLLAGIEKFEVEVNLNSVLFGDELRISGIYLHHPEIFIKVLKDGTANYDIAIADTTVTEEEIVETTEQTADDFSFGIDHWEITNGHVIYDDATLPFYTELKGLNHSGSGDFTLSVFDLKTQTRIDTFTVAYGGVTYMKNKVIDIDATLNMNLDDFSFAFKENSIKINDFALGFDGSFAMPEDGFDMDLTFSSQDNTFKSLLSLVPGIYTQDFAGIQTSGSLGFDGAVKGKYTETTMPAFNLGLNVDNARFQYPDLPAAVTNIAIDLRVDNTDGNIDNTEVNLSRFHMEFGNNPIDAKLIVKNLVTYPIEAAVDATLDLGELATMFPMEGLEMRGKFNMKATANGVYDSIQSIIPTTDVVMTLEDGYVKSADFPIPMDNMRLNARVKNSSGRMAETLITVEEFFMHMGEEEISANMTLENLDDYTWNVNLDGGMDIGQVMQVFPIEGMELSGKVYAKVNTSGKMSDLDAERYDKLPTSGDFSVADFKYVDQEYLPQGFVITSAKGSFDPEKITLASFSGNVGKTDMKADGAITNYMNYVFHDELIKGNLNYSSNLVDVNEFLYDEEAAEESISEADTLPLEVVPIPRNIDFTLKSSIKRIIYDNMVMTNAKGDIIIRDGVMYLDGLKVNMLGGQFVFNGSYSTQDETSPAFDMDMAVNNVSIRQSFATFNTVQSLAPIAQTVNGNVTTNFKLKGNLGSDMMPIMSSLDGGGLLEIAQAAIQDSKIVAGITSLTNLDNTSTAAIKDLAMSAKIENGRFSVKPFDIKLGNYATNISGSTGLDGSLDYRLQMDVPPNKLSNEVMGSVSSFLGTSHDPNKPIKLAIGLGGTYSDPKPQLLLDETKSQVADLAKDRATELVKDKAADLIGGDDKTKEQISEVTDRLNKDSIEAAKAEAAAKLKATQDSLKRLAEEKKKAVEDSIKRAVEAEKKKKEEELKKKAADKLNSLFKKKNKGGN